VIGGHSLIAQPLATGYQYSIALDSDGGTIYAWGYNTNGELGDNSTNSRWIPVTVTTSGALSGKTITAVATGNYHTVALDSDGKVYAWGWNSSGQLGDNSTTTSSVPVAVTTSGALSGKTITAITTGVTHTVALDSDGKIYAWGDNDNGQLGDNSTTNSSVPVAVTTSGALSGKTITAIAAGTDYTIALDSDGKVYAWGDNSSGQLGDNSTTDSSVPVAVTTSGALSGKTITAVAGGTKHSLALDSDGKVYAWGWNSSGQLGNNSTTDSSVPVAVTTSGALSGKTITAVAQGSHSRHTVALDSDGKIYAWGINSSGQLGNNSTSTSSVPVAVTTSGALSGKTIRALAAGADHTIALASDSTVYAWGENNYGHLGDNSTTDSSVPVQVLGVGGSGYLTLASPLFHPYHWLQTTAP
jgi:alpha-tubulin suppressor-like RCC1 family protein